MSRQRIRLETRDQTIRQVETKSEGRAPLPSAVSVSFVVTVHGLWP
jgi:hypothetical protein